MQSSRRNVGKDNADVYINRQEMGGEAVGAIADGRRDIETWERLYYGEFDSRRRKRV